MGGEVSPKMVLDHTHTYHLQLSRGKYCLFSNIRWRPRYLCLFPVVVLSKTNRARKDPNQ